MGRIVLRGIFRGGMFWRGEVGWLLNFTRVLDEFLMLEGVVDCTNTNTSKPSLLTNRTRSSYR